MAVSPKRNSSRRNRGGGGDNYQQLGHTDQSSTMRSSTTAVHVTTPTRPGSGHSNTNTSPSSKRQRPVAPGINSVPKTSTRFSDPVLTPRSQRYRVEAIHINYDDEDADTRAATAPLSFLWEIHVMFWMAASAVKWCFPTFLKWIAHDSMVPLVISVCIPLWMTIISIDDSVRHQKTTKMEQKQNDMNEYDKINKISFRSYFWLRYWSMGYAVVQVGLQCIQLFISTMFMHRHHVHIQSYHAAATFPIHISEMQFFVYLYMFALNRSVLSTYVKYRSVLISHEGANNNNEHGTDATAAFAPWEPLAIIDDALRPHLLQLQAVISEPISKELWQRYIHSKAQRLLDALVMLQFLSDDWQDYLLQLLDEGRSLLVLSIFLVLPSSLTQIGIVYVKYLLPSARYCSITVHRTSRISNSTHRKDKAKSDSIQKEESLHLQYWVLNVLLSSCLSGGSWLCWFVPFSTQIIFAMWCYLTFPRTIRQYYSVLETELVTFGLLSGESPVPLKQTWTVRLVKALVKRIPSANDAQGFQWADSEDEDSDIDSDDHGDSASVVSHRRRQRKNRSKNKRTLGSRTMSSPSGLKNFSSSSTMSKATVETKNTVNTDDDICSDHRIGVEANDSNDCHSRETGDDQSEPRSLSGMGDSDDRSVAAVCNADFSNSSHSKYISSKLDPVDQDPPFWEHSSSFRCEPFLPARSFATSADGVIVDDGSIKSSFRSPSHSNYSDADEAQYPEVSSRSSRSMSSENLETTPSFGHYYDGSIRELRRSLREVQQWREETRQSDRLRKMRQTRDEKNVHDKKLHHLPGYLQPTESSRRGSRHTGHRGMLPDGKAGRKTHSENDFDTQYGEEKVTVEETTTSGSPRQVRRRPRHRHNLIT